jgi:hypothetical protein
MKLLGTILAFVATITFGGVAVADSMPGSMMRADGTMTASSGMTAMAHAMASMNSCNAMMSAMHRAMQKATGHCFKVTIENISTADAFTASNGTKWTLPFSPGPFAVTTGANPIFAPGTRDRGQGLRALSEDGNPVPLTTYLEGAYPGSGAFLVPVGGSKPKGITPGERFEFYVVASAKQKLFFVSMFGQSNDWFYGTPSGIALFDGGGKPVGGDQTAAVKLYDAGTEADEELGIGPSQGPRQPHPRFGPDDPNPIVRLATSDPRFIDVSKVMRVTVTPQ